MGTHWERKNQHPHPPPKEKTLDPLGVTFLRWRFFPVWQIFFPKSVKHSLFSEKSPKSNKKTL
jgi:hypothetical protein